MDADLFARAARISLTRATDWAEPITLAMNEFEIDTPDRQAAFIAQTSHESQQYTALVENMLYRSPGRIFDVWPSRFESADHAAYYARDPKKLGNFVYANRLGNGDELSGDGYSYRGRGLIMGTGRDFYQWLSDELDIDFINEPELLEQPAMACLGSACWWADRDLNPLADMGAIDKITRIVNGPAMLGRLERAKLFDHALAVLSL